MIQLHFTTKLSSILHSPRENGIIKLFHLKVDMTHYTYFNKWNERDEEMCNKNNKQQQRQLKYYFARFKKQTMNWKN